MAVPQTKIGLDTVSSLCSSRHPSNVLTGIWTRLIREHFNNNDNLQYGGQNEPIQELRDLVWKGNEDGSTNVQTSTLQIKPVWEYETKDPNRRPGIYVKRNKFTFERIGLSDGLTTGIPRDAAGLVKETPGRYQAVMMLGSHTVFCVGRTGAETELLSQEVTNHIMQFATPLREALALHRLQITEVGEVMILDEFVEHFVVPVVIGYGLTHNWRLIQIQPVLKKIGLVLQP